MKSEKMIKTAKALDKVFRVLRIIIAVCAVSFVVIFGVFTVIYVVNPDAAGFSTDTSVVLGALTLDFAEGVVPSNADILIHGWTEIVPIGVFVFLIWYALGIFRKILKPMTEGNPFSPAVSREIRKLAFVSLIIGVLQSVVSYIQAVNAIHIFELSSLFNSSQIQSVTAYFEFDVSWVIVFFVLLLVSYIFNYGEELQKLSDETL